MHRLAFRARMRELRLPLSSPLAAVLLGCSARAVFYMGARGASPAAARIVRLLCMLKRKGIPPKAVARRLGLTGTVREVREHRNAARRRPAA